MSFPLRLLRKVATRSENAHGTTRRAESRPAPAAAKQTLRACAVEIHFEEFERHECTVNSSELAGRRGAGPYTYRKNPAHTVWGITSNIGSLNPTSTRPQPSAKSRFRNKNKHPTEVEGPELDHPSSVPQVTGPT